MLRKIRSCLCFAKHAKENLSDLNNNQDGNIFFMLFGAVAVVGLLGTAVMSTMRGPLSTMVEIQSRTQAESEMGVASHLALLEATELANAGDCDGDGFVEPLEFADASGLGPVGGGFLPSAVASSRIDPWGTEYGYCAWDAGATTDTIGCDIDASGTNNRLDGNSSPTDETYTVIAIVSAGPDQVFGTTCIGGANPSISKTGDDMVVEFTYASANAASNGLWNLKSGDPTTAQIDKNLEITGAASFSAGIDLTSSSAALSLGAASMLFPNESTLATCNGANDGLIRINTVANPDFLELCDDPTGWVAIGGNLWSTGAGDDIYYDTGTTPQIGIGKTDPSEALDVFGNIDVSGNLDAGGDLIAGGNAEVTGTLDVAGTTTLGVLNATGAVDFSSTLNVTGNITGSSGMYVSNTGTSFAVNVAGHYTGDYRFQVPSGTTRNLTFRHTAGGWDAAKIEVSKLSGSNADGTMHLYTTGHGNSQLFLDELGNVGIGTTSPNAQLHVSGSTILTSTLDAQGTISNSTGNVSIGDNLDISNDLDVTGDIVGENITANDNLYVGTTINVDGDQLGPALNCTSSQKLEWTDGSGWSCVTDLQGGGGGGIPSLDDLTDVAVTTPANGECLIYDNVSGDWENAPCIGTGAGIFEIVSGVIRVKSGAGNYTNDDFVVGSPQLDDDGDANHDNRMFYDKSKGAFRAGGVTSTEWDDANIGAYSFAIGLHNTASGPESFAGGWDSTAAGFAAFAWGNGATANGHTNVAMGQDVTASAGDRAFAFGQSVTTTGSRSFGFGLGNTAGVNPQVSANGSFGIFMGDQSGVDLSVSNRMGLYGGDLLIDDDGTAGSQGCIQYNGTTSELQFSDDCTTFTAFSNGSLGLWTDLTGGRIHYGTTSANQVGIGTSNPQTTLDVNGGVRVGSVSGGAAPTFMAINDLSDVAAAVPSDGDCLVYNNASGDWENVACSSLGVGAINDLSDASTDYVTDHNMLIGEDVANGLLAGNAYNLGIGEHALNGATTSQRNVAIGYAALYSNTAGYNSALGVATMYNATGSNNSAFGYRIMYDGGPGDDNTIMGYNAAYTLDGSDNVIMGSGAGQAATTADTNIMIGYQAGNLTTTGDSNIIIGNAAQTSTITASNEINIGDVITGDMTTGDIAIIGTAALAHPSGTTAQRPATGVNGMIRYNSTLNEFEGYENGAWTSMGGNAGASAIDDLSDGITYAASVFLGGDSGRVSTGDHNTALGDDTLYTNTTGTRNTAIGSNSMWTNNGSYNTAVGVATMYSSTTGDNNAVLGYRIMFGGSTGSDNTVMGYMAANTLDGDNNVMLGSGAGEITAAADDNVFIGYQTANNNTTGARNIIIGANADNLTATTNDYINIGDMITGDMATGDIAIIGTAALAHPSGTTAQRPSTGVNGMIRYNSTTNELEGYENSSWVSIGSGGALSIPIDVEGETVIMEIGTGNIPVFVSAEANENVFVGYGAGENVTPDVPTAGDGESNTFMGFDAGNSTTTGAWNSFFGREAGRNNTTGEDNTHIGDVAGRANTTADGRTMIGAGAGYGNSGATNTFVGAYAGFTNSSGAASVIIGNNAGRQSTSASNVVMIGNFAGRYATANNNTLIGYQSGQAATGAGQLTGTSNTFLGYQTGMVTTSGADNTFIGDVAGRANTTGYSNTFVGADAGYANTDGYYNAFFGAQSGAVNSSGFYNAFFGDYAGNDNTTGDSNTFIGSAAGFNNIGGLDNTFLGRSAGRISTSGGSNVFIGHETADNSTTGSRNIIIGANTDNLTATTDDYLNIGDVIIGDLTTGNIQVVGTAALTNPSGTTAQRPGTGVNGMIRYNSTLSKFEAYENSSWINMIGSGGTTDTLIDADADTQIQVEESADDDTIRFDTAGTERMAILPTGAVLIGTTTLVDVPQSIEKVQIVGDDFVIGTFGDAALTKSDIDIFKADGTQGAPGGVDPGDQIGSIRFTGYDGNSFETRARILAEVDNTVSSGGDLVPTALMFATADDTTDDGIERMRIASDGSIGIGNFSADAIDSTLHLASGDIRLDGGAANEAGCIRFNDTTDKLQFSHDCSTFSDLGTGGSGAINDLSDAAKNLTTNNLFLAHNGGSVGATDNFNTVIGIEALDALNNSAANNNIAIGYQALTANTNGDDNIAIGYQALSITTNGSDNIAIGSETLLVNSTGDRNVAIGNSALIANTLGDDNIVLGDGAMEENTAGNDNIALGNTALGDNIDGDDNIAIGTQALERNTDGDGNIAIGDGALTDAGSSDYSIAIGVDALGNFDGAANTYNTAIGYRSLRGTNGVTIGIENTALGANTGLVFTTGENNVLIGYNAGDSITTGSDNIIIGHDADTPAATTSNHLNIGNTITGDISTKTVTIDAQSNAAGGLILTTDQSGQVADLLTLNNTNGGGNAAGITFKVTDTSRSRIYSYDSGMIIETLAATAPVVFQTNTTQRMVISDSGIGIGNFNADTIESDLHIQSGDIRLDGGAANEAGCIRFNDTTDQLQFSHDCSTYTAMGSASGIAINDLTDAYTDYATDNNIFIGSGAGAAIASGGIQNLFIGESSGALITTSDGNTAVGFETLDVNTSGEYQAAFGSRTLTNNTTGTKNSAFGASAMYYNIDGSNNVALGHLAGRGNSGGSSPENSAFVGYYSGLNITTGINNTLLGYATGSSLSTGGNNILIGASTDTPASSTSNYLNIGDTIYGDLANGLVSIGNTAPAHLLDVGNDATLRMYLSTTTYNSSDLYNLGMYDAANGPRRFTLLSQQGANQQVLQFGDGDPTDSIFGIGSSSDTGTSWDPAFVVTHDQRVGIGAIPAAAANLHITNTTNDARLHFTNGDGTSGDINYDMGTDGFEFRTGGTTVSDTKMYIGDDGDIGIGTTSPTGTLDVITANNSSDTILRIGSGVDSSNTANSTLELRERNGGTYNRGVDLIYNGAAGDHFAINVINSGGTTEALRILRSNGYVGINNAAPDAELDVTGDIEYSGTLTDVSDRRLKDNIKPLGQTLGRIAQIDTYSFTMKEDEDGRTEFGVMAQELEEIFPTLVHTAKDEMGTKSVNYVGLIAPMIEATKELSAENAALKSGLDDLSQQVALLNNMAGNNVGKASMVPYLMLLFGLLGGMGFMLLIQRKQQK